MDWDSCQNLDFMSISDDNIDLRLPMDQIPFEANYPDELQVVAGDNSSLVPNFLGAEGDTGDDIGGFLLQLNFDYQDAFQYTAIDQSFNAVNESQGGWDTATTPSTWSSSNTPLSPTDNFLSRSPLDVLNCQLPDKQKPSHVDSQSESFGLPMPITPMNQPIIPTDVHKQRRRRRRKDSETLKKNERKVCKPERCHICGIGHAQKRDLDRHMVSNHRKEAERLGLDISKVQCRFCELKFDGIRRDRLVRHMKRKHPNVL